MECDTAIEELSSYSKLHPIMDNKWLSKYAINNKYNNIKFSIWNN